MIAQDKSFFFRQNTHDVAFGVQFWFRFCEMLALFLIFFTQSFCQLGVVMVVLSYGQEKMSHVTIFIVSYLHFRSIDWSKYVRGGSVTVMNSWWFILWRRLAAVVQNFDWSPQWLHVGKGLRFWDVNYLGFVYCKKFFPLSKLFTFFTFKKGKSVL